MFEDTIHLVRWIHVTFGSAWFGEVVVINFVLIPALSKYQGAARKDFLNTIFPWIFNLASVLSAVTALSGGILLYDNIGWDVGELFTKGTWGWSVFIGGTLGLILTLFHFFVENHLARKVGVGDPHLTQEAVEDVHLKLKIIPRIGLVVISTIFMLMLNSTHSLFRF